MSEPDRISTALGTIVELRNLTEAIKKEESEKKLACEIQLLHFWQNPHSWWSISARRKAMKLGEAYRKQTAIVEALHQAGERYASLFRAAEVDNRILASDIIMEIDGFYDELLRLGYGKAVEFKSPLFHLRNSINPPPILPIHAVAAI